MKIHELRIIIKAPTQDLLNDDITVLVDCFDDLFEYFSEEVNKVAENNELEVEIHY